jgi:hypothetical protein
MTAAARRKSAALATKTAELALAVPQVVAHRVTRMALAGPTLSARDRKEFDLMSAEKTAAFQQSWNAMAVHAVKANQALATHLFTSLWLPSGKRKPSAAGLTAQLQNAALSMTLGVLGKGLAPVHRTAVANAKRLARTKLR